MERALRSSDAVRMDRHYRYQRHIYDLTRAHYLIGRNHLIRDLKPEPGQSVLEIGCGTAWNLARLAKRYPQAEFFGVDVSNAMLDTARASLRRQGLDRHVTLRQGDATLFDATATFGRSAFDRIFFSYALSMIPQWEQALAHAATLLAPGGSLHVVDFGQCEGLPTMFRKALFAFLAHYTVHPREDLDGLLHHAADRHCLALQLARLHRGYTSYAVAQRTV